MEKHEIIVVGGGVSGLSLAYFSAAAGRETLLIEAQSRLGGCIETKRLGQDFWFELGAHTCYNSYGTLIRLLEGCGLSRELLSRAKVPFRR